MTSRTAKSQISMESMIFKMIDFYVQCLLTYYCWGLRPQTPGGFAARMKLGAPSPDPRRLLRKCEAGGSAPRPPLGLRPTPHWGSASRPPVGLLPKTPLEAPPQTPN